MSDDHNSIESSYVLWREVSKTIIKHGNQYYKNLEIVQGDDNVQHVGALFPKSVRCVVQFVQFIEFFHKHLQEIRS